ncbi:FOXI1 [Branchiostoma lanceolatum]|uniref:Forkhead box protein G1 n=1 Tax=Branchiostoma lanceolatum TaxID=7740 RepID=A0A8K0EQE5_BRALA|nr:FOXI1 [Branchiostoma lanceolatum]
MQTSCYSGQYSPALFGDSCSYHHDQQTQSFGHSYNLGPTYTSGSLGPTMQNYDMKPEPASYPYGDTVITTPSVSPYAPVVSTAFQRISQPPVGVNQYLSPPTKTYTDCNHPDENDNATFHEKAAGEAPVVVPKQEETTTDLQAADDKTQTDGGQGEPGKAGTDTPASGDGDTSDNNGMEEILTSLEKKEDAPKEPPSADVKPPLSYIALIAKAILGSPAKRLSLGSIYQYITDNYPYYQNRGQGWRNSVRHNLSLNDCFIKAGRCEDGKGNYWAIHPANIEDFARGDFRQRRRSRRRRGAKKEMETLNNGYGMANSYLNPSTGPITPGYSFPPSLSSIYSPYTDAERKAYRLDEVLYRQHINNPFFKWYNSSCRIPQAAPSPNPSSPVGMYPNSNPQWQYSDTQNSQSMFPISPNFQRFK